MLFLWYILGQDLQGLGLPVLDNSKLQHLHQRLVGKNRFHFGFGHHPNHIRSQLGRHLLRCLPNCLGLAFHPCRHLASRKLRCSFDQMVLDGHRPNRHHNQSHSLCLLLHQCRHREFDKNRYHYSSCNHLDHHCCYQLLHRHLEFRHYHHPDRTCLEFHHRHHQCLNYLEFRRYHCQGRGSLVCHLGPNHRRKSW